MEVEVRVAVTFGGLDLTRRGNKGALWGAGDVLHLYPGGITWTYTYVDTC